MPKNYFQHGGCHHFELSKIAVLVMWTLFAYNSTSAIQLSHTSTKMAHRYSQKQFSIQRPTAILNKQNFKFLSNVHHRNGNSHPHTKFDRNQIIQRWNMEMKLFSKWRPSAILDLRKLPSWSRDIISACDSSSLLQMSL